MNLWSLLKLLHILGVLWLVSGLAGRAIVTALAARASDIRAIVALMQASHRFEMLMVRPSSFVVLVAGIATAMSQGLPIFGVFQGGPNWIFVSLLLFLSIFILIPTVFIPRGIRFRKALDAAIEAGQPTPELAAAFADRAVAAGHAWEWVAVVVVTALMVTKPI